MPLDTYHAVSARSCGFRLDFGGYGVQRHLFDPNHNLMLLVATASTSEARRVLGARPTGRAVAGDGVGTPAPWRTASWRGCEDRCDVFTQGPRGYCSGLA